MTTQSKNQSIKESSWQLSWHSQCNVDESDLHSHLPCSKEVMMVLFDLLWTNPKNVKQATMKCLREDNKILFCQLLSLWVSIVTPPSFGTYFLKKKYWKLFLLTMTWQRVSEWGLNQFYDTWNNPNLKSRTIQKENLCRVWIVGFYAQKLESKPT